VALANEPAAFVPADFRMRLLANSLNLDLGDSIATWPDSSVEQNDATQETSSFQPTFQEALFEGQTFKVVRFDTVDDGMETPLVIPENCPFSIFAMWRPSDLSLSCIISSATVNWMMGTFNGGMLCYFENWTAGVTMGNTSDFVLFEVRITPGEPPLRVFINGVQAVIFYGGTASPEQVAFGASGAPGYPGGCDTPEIIIYDRMLSDAEAEGVRAYFQAEYNYLKR
jgi:hypothetical protein